MQGGGMHEMMHDFMCNFINSFPKNWDVTICLQSFHRRFPEFYPFIVFLKNPQK
jgi:hypothetical protein